MSLSRTISPFLQNNLIHITPQYGAFFGRKVHIKYEKRRNEAIKLSIKDLKGLWKAA